MIKALQQNYTSDTSYRIMIILVLHPIIMA